MAGKPASKSTSSKKSTSYEKQFMAKVKKRRPGIVSKNNTSNIKSSRNYTKAYRGQGR
jgi:hypothetical protein